GVLAMAWGVTPPCVVRVTFKSTLGLTIPLVEVQKENQMAQDSPEVELQREDEDDHDLLTYGEAGVRLQQEIFEQRKRVEDLKAGGGQSLESARERLARLEDAFERNARQPINDETFEKFFGYPGKARRNT